jgi:hypothetical protein
MVDYNGWDWCRSFDFPIKWIDVTKTKHPKYATIHFGEVLCQFGSIEMTAIN